jgi:2-polyprenyl-3-methyl-5-hydroxy-6-metoxy-1,4-benzoquinol methylase
VTGIDASREQIELALALGTTGVLEADLFAFAGEHRRRYDYVLAVDVVEHFDREQAVPLFETLHAMLRPGGRLILRTPNGVSPFHGRILFGDVTHGLAYTSRSMAQVAAAAGFAGVEIYACGPVGHGIKQLVRRMIWRLAEALLVTILAAETGMLSGHVVTQNLVAVLTVPGRCA